MPKTISELIKYGVVGLSSNLSLYLVYLLLTGFGVGHKTAMTMLYASGVLITFSLNRNWTFKHSGDARESLPKYVVAYAYGYIAQFSLLFLFVDVLGYDHRIVQFVLIFVIAAQLFLIQKLWTFRHRPECG